MERVSNEKKLELLCDHYKDSFTYLREYIKQRDKLFIVVLVVIFFHYIQISLPDQPLMAFNDIVEKSNVGFSFGKGFLSDFLWFLLLSVSLRYFQIDILINRQYRYLHKLEENICKKAKDKGFCTREGTEYLKTILFFQIGFMLYTHGFFFCCSSLRPLLR